jgi:nucleotide-binding universal stress UspA family protein
MSSDPAGAAPAPETPPKTAGRIFLVVVDETPELKVALQYACLRAKKTGGRVALLYVMERGDFQQWMGVNDLMQEEARQEAEQTLQRMAADVQKQSGAMPVLYVREGDRREELMKLIDEEPSISILVLGAATGQRGPGPLVTALTSKFVGKLRVPVTIVPGHLSAEDVDHVG